MLAYNMIKKHDQPIVYAFRLNEQSREKLQYHKVWGFSDGIHTLLKFRHYLLGNTFVFYVDHMVLVYLLNKLQVSGCIVRWLLLFLDYEFIVVHKPKHTHVMVDTLYRLKNSCPLLVQILFFG